MLPIVLALLAAVSFGLSNYLGGILSRRVNSLTLTVFSQAAGLLLALLVVLGRGVPPPDLGLLLYPVLSGLSTGISLLALYKALSLASISVVSPISSSAVILPVVVGLVRGEQTTAAQLLGMALTIVGVILVSRRASQGVAHKSALAGIGFALIAALGFGGFYVFLGLAREVDPVWSIVIIRAASGLTALSAIPFTPLVFMLPWRTFGGITVVGLLATSATLFIAVATSIGQLSTTSVISSLSTLVPIVLSRFLLGERLAPSQQAGVVAALSGVALIASRI